LTLALAGFDGREDEFEAMLNAARACEDPVCLAIALGNCGELRLADGDVASAIELISQSLRMCGQLAMAYVGAFSLDSAATLLASVGEPAAAVRVEARRRGRDAADPGLLVATAGGTAQPAARRRRHTARRGRLHRRVGQRRRPHLPRRGRRRESGTADSCAHSPDWSFVTGIGQFVLEAKGRHQPTGVKADLTTLLKVASSIAARAPSSRVAVGGRDGAKAASGPYPLSAGKWGTNS
jgi:hypothetical protein